MVCPSLKPRLGSSWCPVVACLSLTTLRFWISFLPHNCLFPSHVHLFIWPPSFVHKRNWSHWAETRSSLGFLKFDFIELACTSAFYLVLLNIQGLRLHLGLEFHLLSSGGMCEIHSWIPNLFSSRRQFHPVQDSQWQKSSTLLSLPCVVTVLLLFPFHLGPLGGMVSILFPKPVSF